MSCGMGPTRTFMARGALANSLGESLPTSWAMRWPGQAVQADSGLGRFQCQPPVLIINWSPSESVKVR